MLQDLKREPSGKFENFCRMSTVDFEFLLNKIGPLITKRDTNMRKAIPIQERFCVALRFFATGDSFKSLSYLFKISPQTVSTCVFDVCNALCHVLQDQIKVSINIFSHIFLIVFSIIIKSFLTETNTVNISNHKIIVN